MAEDLNYQTEPYDLYENANRNSKCRYSRKRCEECPFSVCKEDYTHSDSFMGAERHKLMLEYYHRGATIMFISKLFSLKPTSITNALKKGMMK